MWRGPRALCSRGGDCEAACERSGFGGLILSGGVWCCSGTTAEDPAWRWPSQCGAVCFCRFSRRHKVTLQTLAITGVCLLVGAAADGVELLLEVCLKWSCVVRLASMS